MGKSQLLIQHHVNQCMDLRPTKKQKIEPASEVKLDPIVLDEPIDDGLVTATSTKQCPFYKKITGTNFAVDAFNYGKISGISAYFLSHFHYDHYIGLTSKFNYGPLYCSKITANLLKHKIKIRDELINILEIGNIYKIGDCTVELIDANHCPGAVIFLFKTKDRTIIHTGDFRASDMHLNHPSIRNTHIDTVYLDTTYCDPSYAFPAQRDILDGVADLCKKCSNKAGSFDDLQWIANELGFWKKNSRLVKIDKSQKSIQSWLKKEEKYSTSNGGNFNEILFVVGTYLIGKEKVFLEISKCLNCEIFCKSDKKKILECLESEDIKARLTSQSESTCLHVVPMKIMRTDFLESYRKQYFPKAKFVIAFKPTGWTFSSKKSDNILPAPTLSRDNRIAIINVPYSEHSSFEELERFIRGLRSVRKIIPTVNIGKAETRNKMNNLFSKWISR